MANRNARSNRSREYTTDFPEVLGRRLEEHAVLLGGIVALRELGPRAQKSLDAVLDVWVVKKARLSWELWEMIVTNAGDDPGAMLRRAISERDLQYARYAFWGDGPNPLLRVVK